jgi:hypothetical protein
VSVFYKSKVLVCVLAKCLFIVFSFRKTVCTSLLHYDLVKGNTPKLSECIFWKLCLGYKNCVKGLLLANKHNKIPPLPISENARAFHRERNFGLRMKNGPPYSNVNIRKRFICIIQSDLTWYVFLLIHKEKLFSDYIHNMHVKHFT